MNTVYLDNAATSFPKPQGVSGRMKYYLDCVGANVNRSVYTAAQEAGLVTLTLRQRLARLFRFPEPPTHVILTPGATFALNTLLSGLLRPGDHCIVSGMEHNAVMRPLLRLPEVSVSRLPCDSEGFADAAALPGLLRDNTKLVVMAHGSNVCGTVQDAEAIGRICAEHGVPFALDAAQTAGHLPIDFSALRLSALAVPGHKGLLGPGGTGALLLRDDLAQRLTPLTAGGTGSASDSEYLPDYLPDFFSVILSRGQIRMDETKCSQGHVQVQGTLQFRVLYRTGQNEWNICSLEGEIPFHEMMTLDEAKEFDMAQTEAILEDLTVRMINARKLNIRALVEIKVWARERVELNIPVAIDSEYPLEELHNTEVYLELCYRGTERWKLKEEVRLPSNKPNIRQLLWQQHQLLGREIRANQGNVQVQGEIQIFLLYLGMEEDRLQWLELRVPYQYELDVAEAESDMIPCVSGQEPVMICRVQEDTDGEERMLLLEADTPVELRLYREVKREQLVDAYSLERQLQLQTKQVKFPQL